jgi:tRNA(fMet)-specific endonuclease VapC
MRSDRYLVDSNIVIYRVSDEERLTREVKAIFDDTSNLIHVPSKCVEELIWLQQSGKIEVKLWKSPKDIITYILESGLYYGIKYVDIDHLRRLAELPVIHKHKDNTDRIAIAQAMAEGIPIISSDEKFPDYVPYGLKLIFNKR